MVSWVMALCRSQLQHNHNFRLINLVLSPCFRFTFCNPSKYPHNKAYLFWIFGFSCVSDMGVWSLHHFGASILGLCLKLQVCVAYKMPWKCTMEEEWQNQMQNVTTVYYRFSTVCLCMWQEQYVSEWSKSPWQNPFIKNPTSNFSD